MIVNLKKQGDNTLLLTVSVATDKLVVFHNSFFCMTEDWIWRDEGFICKSIVLATKDSYLFAHTGFEDITTFQSAAGFRGRNSKQKAKRIGKNAQRGLTAGDHLLNLSKNA